MSAMRVAQCRCGARIVWAKTARGKNMPVNADPDDTGTVVLRGEPPLALVVPDGAYPEEPRYRAHWADCPRSDEFRRT